MFRCVTVVGILVSCLSAFVLVEAVIASTEFLKRQKAVYEISWRVDQPEMVPEIYDLGLSYDLWKNLGSYKHEECVTEFLDLYERGMLPRREIFSIFYPNHADQAIALFKVFYHSKDFETLYKTAAWARIHVNEGLFVYAFSVAVVHHPETQKIRVPALSEIYPYLYFSDEVIREAYNAKGYTDPTKLSSVDDAIVIYANSSNYKLLDGEHKLRYFTEDVEVNDIVYYSNLCHPFWMPTAYYGRSTPIRGEVYFWAYRLQMAHYYMERLSNDLGEVEDFDWSFPMPYGFHPSLSYHNGKQLPQRDENAVVPSYNYKFLKQLRDYEQRISMAIDLGKVIDKDGKLIPIDSRKGIQTLGNLIEGNAASVNHDFYGSYEQAARNVLGFSPPPKGKFKVVPSLLQYNGVDQRDPMFWSLAKKILGFYEQFVKKLRKYTYQELGFPGLTIETVRVDRITTFFEYYDYLISSAVKIYRSDDKTVIKARRKRLTHKPYTYTITVQSEKKVKANVRIFLGPKYDVHGEEFDITENYKNFVLLDDWIVDLKVGENRIIRHSTESLSAVGDYEDGNVFYEKIVRAMKGDEVYEIPRKNNGYPGHMVIPKGKKEGLACQFLIFVSPYEGGELFQSDKPISGGNDFLNVPLGFPLERPVASNFTELQNAYFKDLFIYHKDESDMDRTV